MATHHERQKYCTFNIFKISIGIQYQTTYKEMNLKKSIILFISIFKKYKFLSLFLKSIMDFFPDIIFSEA